MRTDDEIVAEYATKIETCVWTTAECAHRLAYFGIADVLHAFAAELRAADDEEESTERRG